MKTVSRILAIALMLTGLASAQQPPEGIPKLTDNAALQYWFAFYFMYEESKSAEKPIPNAESWPKKLSELYPRYVTDPKVFFVVPGDVPKGILPFQIDQETHFSYSPQSLRRRTRGGAGAICVLRTKKDDYYGPVRGRIEGYADGHVEWKPRKRDEPRPDAATFGMNNAKQLLLALFMFQDDQPREKKSRSMSDFIYTDLVGGTVPASEARRSEIRDICEKSKRAVTEYLRRGAEMKRCDFGLDYSRGYFMLLPHLSKARKLARNAIAYGKLLEAERMPLEAARVYCDVMAMGQHVAQDTILVSGLVGCAVEKMASGALRQLLAHEPPAEVCELVLARLSALPRPYVAFGPRLSLEAKLIKPMLFATFADGSSVQMSEQEKKEIRRLLKADDAPLAAEDVEKTKKRLTAYFEEYVDRMETAAEISTGPYPESGPALAELCKLAGESSNPLLKALMPDIHRTIARQAAAQTRLCATQILAAAALQRARTRRYPKTLDDLKPTFPKGIPLDPMADKPFTYRLDVGRPCLESAGPLGKGKEGKDEDYIFSVKRILERERKGRRWSGR